VLFILNGDIVALLHKREHGTQFRHVGPLFILDQGRNLAGSIDILADHGLRLITYKEALANASVLIKELNGKWFFLDGKRPEENGIFTYDANGELVRPTCDEVHDKKVRVYLGDQSLILDVDNKTSNQRFCLDSAVDRTEVSLAVVGMQMDPKLDAARRA
jgi:hypothetical protein